MRLGVYKENDKLRMLSDPKKLNIFLSLSTFVRIKKETSIHFPDLARKLDRTF